MRLRKRLATLVLLAALLAVLTVPIQAAGQVTDTLTVKVGYYGMGPETYVEVGTYHWSELSANLPISDRAYSFFRIDPDENYQTVIDSARGFSIGDLLDYAGIYTGDVTSIQFYTKDQSVGTFTSFTAQDLFTSNRYYFNDLAAHIKPVYDENGNFVKYDGTEAWSDYQTVQPMLALEDNWATFEIGTEHTAPNFSSLGTGNRFRLLFGQADPLETRTSQSAKYVHTVLVTLNGAPEIKDELPEIDGTIGSHTLTFNVNVDNQTLLQALGSLLNIASSDSSVLEITGITVTPSSQYSDVASVSVNYTVHTAGTANLNIGYAGGEIIKPQTITTGNPEPTPDNPDDPNKPDDPANPDDPAKPNPDTGPNGGQGNKPNNNNNNNNNNKPNGSSASTNGQALQKPTANGQASQTPAGAAGGQRVHVLSEALAQQLAGRQAASPKDPDGDAPVQETVQAVTMQTEDRRWYYLGTALGALLLAALGAGSAVGYYRKGRIDA